MSPALADRFLTTAPPVKSQDVIFNKRNKNTNITSYTKINFRWRKELKINSI